MRRKHVSSSPESQPLQKRASASAERDIAILKAALEEFAQNGFAAARMEDIAQRAGVAKGTIYLRFRDKEALFEAIVRQEVSPVVDAVSADLRPGESIRMFLERAIVPFLHDLNKSPQGAVIRLLFAEAARFPRLAELYFRTVVEPAMERFQILMRRSLKKKELSNPELVHFPQLIIAPVVVGVLWSGLFDRFHQLNVEMMVRAHLDHFFAAKKFPSPASRNSKLGR